MRILFISPHCDDDHLSCGATIHKLTNQGHECYSVAFSDCGVPGIRDEFKAACDHLGVKESVVLDFKRREFDDKEVLQALIDMRTKYEPDTVYTPSKDSYHFDHSTVGRMALQAFKHLNHITYLAEWDQRVFRTNFYQSIQTSNIMAKVSALMKYGSQKDKTYFGIEHILARARVHGQAINTEFAEPFEIINLIA